jgi:hypothetical protein
MKAVKSCMPAVIFELSMSASLIKEDTVQPMPTNMFLSFSVALHNHSLTPASSVFSWQPLEMEVTWVSLNLCRIYWLSWHLYEAGGTGSATLLPCFPHYTAFPGCSPIAWLHPITAHQPIVHQISYALGPDTSAQVRTTWPSFCAQRLATLNLRQCVSQSCQFS